MPVQLVVIAILKPDVRLDGTLETYQIGINGAAIKILN